MIDGSANGLWIYDGIDDCIMNGGDLAIKHFFVITLKECVWSRNTEEKKKRGKWKTKHANYISHENCSIWIIFISLSGWNVFEVIFDYMENGWRHN